MASVSDATSSAALGTVENLTEMDDIQKAYDALSKEEEAVNKELSTLLEQQASLESKMISLHKMLPNLQILETDSRQLSSMIKFTAELADNVSGKVRKLDVAKSRVSDCITRVQDIMDLKHCTDGVKTALQNEDYEKAAGHIHRFRSLDEGVIRMTADASEGSTLDVSFQLLSDSEAKLQKIVEVKFDEAVHVADAASVERFFKIFPLLGLHDKGLTKFGKYLSAKLSQTMDRHLEEALRKDVDDKRASVIFADTITQLFEEIARIVEIHQPLVETYFGPGRLFMLLQVLQKECDRQARRIIEKFKAKRQYEQKVKLVRQSLMIHKPQSGDKVDPRDLDLWLSEVVLIHARAELYLRFFHRRALGDFEVASQDEETQAAHVIEVEKFLGACDLSREMQELIGCYIMMEEYFMREMISKAVQMDAMEEGVHTSSMVDDAFFIVKKSVRRAVSSDSVDGVCAMLNLACGIIEGDFREVLFSRLRAGFPSGFDLQQAYNLVQSSLQQGKFQTADLEKEKAKALFLTTLNNAEVSCQYCKTLKTNLETEVLKIQRISDQGRAKLESCLSELGGTSGRFREVVEFGFSQLASSAIKPRLKPLVEGFLATSHNISEEEFSNYEANDPWVQSCIVVLDTMLSNFKAALTPANYDHFVNLLAGEKTLQLEKAIFKMTFNRLGGLQFDKELRALVGYLSSVTTWTIRDKFARLTQMATILNLERVSEILDYWGQNSGPLTWRLTPTEVRQVLALRIDFRGEDIKRLKL